MRLLDDRGLNYAVHVVDQDLTRDELISQFPDQKKLPIILLDGQMIGGYEELLDHLNPALKETENGDGTDQKRDDYTPKEGDVLNQLQEGQ
jgi:hypothetical protein